MWCVKLRLPRVPIDILLEFHRTVLNSLKQLEIKEYGNVL